ncbi:MAG: hypothetical protein NXH82_02390 [Rhodobacteraceae bacterium]|nr:hypothetical protein [Paracoccaceae bacterium]
MQRLRQFGLTGGTIAVALGIGYVMQMDATPQSLGYGPDVQAGVLVAMNLDDDNTTLDVSGIALTAAEHEAELRTVAQNVVPKLPDTAPAVAASCAVEADAETLPGAMVDLRVQAPCMANERLTVHHNGMMFTDTTDSAGEIRVRVPALAPVAVMIVEFANGNGAVATTQVPSLAFYDRVVLQWAGDTGFELHAREFGAGYGEAGHVWHGAPRAPDAAAMGNQGFLTRLGDADAPSPLIADIYTFPRATASQDGVIALSIETEVTARNCGREIEAQTLELRDDGVLRTSDVGMSVPGCAAVGNFLVLNNLVDDLTVAGK